MQRKISGAALITAVLVASPAHGAEPPAVIKIPRLTVEAADKITHAAMAECRKAGIQIGVTVLGRGGHPLAVLRDTLAPDLTLTVSLNKAYTALSFNAATSSMEGQERFTKQPFSVGKTPGIIIAAGGLPIVAAGNIVGGVGVSGAPTGEQDEKCARAGLQAIEFDLESANP